MRAYGGKRCVFRLAQNDCRLVVERREKGREFQTVGAANEKDRRPEDDLSGGTVNKSLSAERRWRAGVYGTSKVVRYDGD